MSTCALPISCVAIGIAFANFSNARIVERFGARRVSQAAVFAFMVTALAQIVAALSGVETLTMFTLLMMVNVGLIGFIGRSEEHTSELQSLMRISYAVFCLKKKTKTRTTYNMTQQIRTNI